MKQLTVGLGGALALTLFGSHLDAGNAHAESVADFYRGKQITIAVVAVGGAYGKNGTLLADHMGRHIPGNPSMVVQVKSGGGGRTLMNWLYNVAPQDGTAIGFLHKDIAAFSLVQPDGVKYKAEKFQWLGRVAPMNTVMFLWHTAPAKTLADLRSTEIVMGASGKSHPTAMFPRLFNNLLGTKFKIVTGYRGSADILLAIEQGEAGGATFTWDTVAASRPHWVSEKKIVPIAHVSLEKESDMPDVPLLVDLMTNPADREVAFFLVSGSKVGRAFGAAPGTPADRVAALRKAFDDVVEDPAYLAAARKVAMPVEPLPGAELQALVAQVAATSPAVVERARAAMGLQ